MKAKCSSLLAGFALLVFSQPVLALTVPIFCGSNPNAIGEITVNASGTGISGGFSSFVPVPGPPTLAGAAAACGEDHFNWYQIVTAATMPPPGFTAPFIDPPPGGYPIAFDDTWADTLPWYYDEWQPGPTPPGRTLDEELQISSRTHTNLLDFGDFPGGAPGFNASFKTWLVSLNADGSLHTFHSGFSWDYTQPGNRATGSVGNIQSLGDEWFTDPHPPTAAEYNNLLTGFASSTPEPATFVLFGGGTVLFALVRRRAAARTSTQFKD